MIRKKLFEIVSEAEDIEKSGFNERSRYNFVEEKRVKKMAKDLFIKHKVLATYQVTDSVQLLNNNYKVTIAYKFEDIEDNSSIQGIWSGAGHGGDKGLFKAITGAIKSLLMHNLMITSGEDPDEEKAEPLVKPDMVQQLENAMGKSKVLVDNEAKINKIVQENPDKVVCVNSESLVTENPEIVLVDKTDPIVLPMTTRGKKKKPEVERIEEKMPPTQLDPGIETQVAEAVEVPVQETNDETSYF